MFYQFVILLASPCTKSFTSFGFTLSSLRYFFTDSYTKLHAFSGSVRLFSFVSLAYGGMISQARSVVVGLFCSKFIGSYCTIIESFFIPSALQTVTSDLNRQQDFFFQVMDTFKYCCLSQNIHFEGRGPGIVISFYLAATNRQKKIHWWKFLVVKSSGNLLIWPQTKLYATNLIYLRFGACHRMETVSPYISHSILLVLYFFILLCFFCFHCNHTVDRN